MKIYLTYFGNETILQMRKRLIGKRYDVQNLEIMNLICNFRIFKIKKENNELLIMLLMEILKIKV